MQISLYVSVDHIQLKKWSQIFLLFNTEKARF